MSVKSVHKQKTKRKSRFSITINNQYINEDIDISTNSNITEEKYNNNTFDSVKDSLFTITSETDSDLDCNYNNSNSMFNNFDLPSIENEKYVETDDEEYKPRSKPYSTTNETNSITDVCIDGNLNPDRFWKQTYNAYVQPLVDIEHVQSYVNMNVQTKVPPLPLKQDIHQKVKKRSRLVFEMDPILNESKYDTDEEMEIYANMNFDSDFPSKTNANENIYADFFGVMPKSYENYRYSKRYEMCDKMLNTLDGHSRSLMDHSMHQRLLSSLVTIGDNELWFFDRKKGACGANSWKNIKPASVSNSDEFQLKLRFIDVEEDVGSGECCEETFIREDLRKFIFNYSEEQMNEMLRNMSWRERKDDECCAYMRETIVDLNRLQKMENYSQHQKMCKEITGMLENNESRCQKFAAFQEIMNKKETEVGNDSLMALENIESLGDMMDFMKVEKRVQFVDDD